MKNIAVVLSGCRVFDGSEIHEAVLTLLALSKNEISYECFAPDKEQSEVVNHLTRKPTNETRNVLVESKRIARGNIKPLAELKAENFAAVIFPGGTGAIKNLSNYAYEGANFAVDKDVEKVILEFHSAGKPIGALCIAPMVIAKIINAEVTIGNDKTKASEIKSFGSTHTNKEFNEVAIDEKNRIVTNPCYMVAENIYQVSIGAEATVEAILGLMKR